VSGRCGILGLGKGRSAGLEREKERRRIEASFDVLDVPGDIRAEIVEALDSSAWEWFRDCDGCTGVSEIYWPTIYFPPCLRHDFDCATGRNGLQASRRFYRLQRAYGVGAARSWVRAAGVTMAWYGWGKWAARNDSSGATPGAPHKEG
jgi:hypothetical protein